jgi:hypothetical protein
MRTLAVWLTLASLAGCNRAPSSPKPTPGTGGSAPATGGTSGSGGGASATGGSIGGGTGGAAVMIDAAPVVVSDASSASVAPDGAPTSSDAAVSVDGLPAGIPGHEWVIPCDPSWSKAQCCAHYCGCMARNCADREPKDCMATCTAPGNNWNLKCKVEQCFESLDPRFPMDHGSHCGHATEAAHCQGIIP